MPVGIWGELRTRIRFRRSCKWDWQWCQCQCTGSGEPGSETRLETKHQEDSEEESSSAESVADEGSDAISRVAPMEVHWTQVTSRRRPYRRFPSPTLDCRSKFWRALIRVIALADAAFADIQQAVHSLDFSKIKPIPHVGFEFNSEGNFVFVFEFQTLN